MLHAAVQMGAVGFIVARGNALVAHVRETLLGGRTVNNHDLHAHWSDFLPLLSHCLKVRCLCNIASGLVGPCIDFTSGTSTCFVGGSIYIWVGSMAMLHLMQCRQCLYRHIAWQPARPICAHLQFFEERDMKLYDLLPTPRLEQPFVPFTNSALVSLLQYKRVKGVKRPYGGSAIPIFADAWAALLNMDKCALLIMYIYLMP